MEFVRPVGSWSAAMTLALSAAVAGTAAPIVAPTGGTAVADAVAGTERPGPSTRYVALGDSYSAGVGTFDPSATEPCHRSAGAFPELIAGRYGWTLDSQACDGATTADVQLRQLPALTADTDAVSFTVGGNDAGFTPVLTACALPSWIADCAGAVRTAVRTTRTLLPSRLAALYGTIRRKAPNATVVTVGYPRLFGRQDCDLATFFTPGELTRLNAALDVIDGVLADRAERAGVGFVDVRAAFTGHATCTAEPWVNGLSWPIGESYHPNRAGQQAYAALVGPALAPNLPARLVMPLPGRPGDPGEPTLTAASARRLPTLATALVEPKNLARAQRLGIPRATVVRLAQALGGGSGAAAAALRELRALDRQVEARLR